MNLTSETMRPPIQPKPAQRNNELLSCQWGGCGGCSCFLFMVFSLLQYGLIDMIDWLVLVLIYGFLAFIVGRLDCGILLTGISTIGGIGFISYGNYRMKKDYNCYGHSLLSIEEVPLFTCICLSPLRTIQHLLPMQVMQTSLSLLWQWKLTLY